MTSNRRPGLWRDKSILAPMVRVGTLPLRLLALKHGAGLVYSPEIVDKAIIGSRRVLNGALGTVDFVREGRLVFRTHPSEKDRLVFQIGSSDPALALEAARLVQHDVAAVDLNCGCPKKFSTQAGMGAALLRTPELLCSILRSLVEGCAVPVSAKIRLFLPPHMEHTESLIEAILQSGVSALAIHARDPGERSERHPAHWDLFRSLASGFHRANQRLYARDEDRATLILNGDVGLKDGCSHEPGWLLQQVLADAQASAFMIARAAQWNVSLFATGFTAPTPPLSVTAVTREYLVTAVRTGNHWNNTKYVLQQMWNRVAAEASGAERAAALRLVSGLQRCRSTAELTGLFGVPLDAQFQEDALMDADDGPEP